MSLTRRPRLALGLALLLAAAANGVLHGVVVPQSNAFDGLPSEFAQHVFGVASDLNFNLGGVVALQNGDLIVSECAERGAKLHHFDASTTETVKGTPVHPEEEIGNGGGCGLALHPNGFLYSNTKDTSSGGAGVVEIAITPKGDEGELEAKVTRRFGRLGNGLGIAVHPVTNNLVYADAGCKPPAPKGFTTCQLVEVAPDGTQVRLIPMPSVTYSGGVAFDPSGQFLFITDRLPSTRREVVIADAASGAVVQSVPLPNDPVGLGFRLGSPRFVVTNNQDGSMTRLDFAGDDYTTPPVVSDFAVHGFRGDFVQAGPDTCLYVTQYGVKYNNGEFVTATTNSIVRICDGFAPPPGITPDPLPLPSSICGAVYHDVNNDGSRGGEAGIAGVAIALTGSDTLGRPVTQTTSTAEDGGYCFGDLKAGSYTVAQSQPGTYFDGRDTTGTAGAAKVENDRFGDITLAAGVDAAGYDFGEIFASSLCGVVYLDANNDGQRQGGESAIGGVAIALDGTDDGGAAVTMSATTGPDGRYCFTALRPGTYTIRETQPDAYRDGKDTQGIPGTGTAGNDVFDAITLAQDTQGDGNNFGEQPLETDMSIVATAPGTVMAGSPFSYTIRVDNRGPSPADDVVISSPVAASTTFVALTAPAGWTCTTPLPGAGGAITCRKASMAVAETAALHVTALTACSPGVTAVTVAGSVASLTPEGNPANNSASATTALSYPAPTITNASASAPSSWPPNHKLVDVGVTYTVSGGCGGGTPATALSVSGNDGADAGDWQVVDANLVRLRSERSGGDKNGRTYSITITATDAGGVRVEKTVTVHVPHDQRKKK